MCRTWRVFGLNDVDDLRNGLDVEVAPSVVDESTTLHVDVPPALVNVETHECSEFRFIDPVVVAHDVEKF